MSVNPYDPPDFESTPLNVGDKPKSKTNLRSLVIPTIVGAAIGSIVWPITRDPGDPPGHAIAFGLAGLASLFSAIVFRAVLRSNGTVADGSTLSTIDRDTSQRN